MHSWRSPKGSHAPKWNILSAPLYPNLQKKERRQHRSFARRTGFCFAKRKCLMH